MIMLISCKITDLDSQQKSADNSIIFLEKDDGKDPKFKEYFQSLDENNKDEIKYNFSKNFNYQLDEKKESEPEGKKELWRKKFLFLEKLMGKKKK